MKATRMVHPVEGLESRRLLSAGPVLRDDGLLRIYGEKKIANEIVVQLDAADATKLNVSFNGVLTTYNVADVSQIRMHSGRMSDLLEINELNGAIAIPAVIFGYAGDDTLIGGSGNDFIKGLSGRDVITGGAGNDLIHGGVGDDLISAGDGNDLVKGDNGNDTISGGADNDLLRGLSGRDSISGDDGDDYLDGGSGDDDLLGGEGIDWIRARAGRDNVNGGAGADILRIGKRTTNDPDPEDTLI